MFGRCVFRNGAQKLLGVLITIGEAVAYVVSGMYGDVRDLGSWNAILIIVQVREVGELGGIDMLFVRVYLLIEFWRV